MIDQDLIHDMTDTVLEYLRDEVRFWLDFSDQESKQWVGLDCKREWEGEVVEEHAAIVRERLERSLTEAEDDIKRGKPGWLNYPYFRPAVGQACILRVGGQADIERKAAFVPIEGDEVWLMLDPPHSVLACRNEDMWRPAPREDM